MPRISYNPEVPTLAVEEIDSVIRRSLWVLPLWVEEVRVMWESNSNQGLMRVNIYRDYRWIQLIINPDTILSPSLEESMLHEFIHPALAESKKVQHDLLEALDIQNENPALYRWAAEVIRMANEAAVQDIVEAIIRRDALIDSAE